MITIEVDGFEIEESIDDPGLACAIASMLACYWKGHISDVVGWIHNIRRRIWMPIAWDETDCSQTITGSVGDIARVATKALAACGNRYDIDSEQTYAYSENAEAALHELVRLLMPGDKPGTNYWPRRIEDTKVTVSDGVKHKAALCLRYVWLARGHEKNNRWNPKYDWDAAISIARKLGVRVNEDDHTRVWVFEIISKLK